MLQENILSGFLITTFSKLKELNLESADLHFIHLPLLGRLQQLQSLNVSHCCQSVVVRGASAEDLNYYMGQLLHNLTSLKTLKIGVMTRYGDGSCLQHASMSLENLNIFSFCNGNTYASHLSRFGLRQNLLRITSTCSFNLGDNENLAALLETAIRIWHF